MLIDEYRESDAGDIRRLYGAIREEHEIDATVLQFVPIGTLRDFRERYTITGTALAANL